MKKMLLFLFCVLFALSVAPLVIAGTMDGADLLEERCSVCHPSARPKSKSKTPEQWENTVTRMMSKGARLSAEEKKVLLQYLSKTYKP